MTVDLISGYPECVDLRYFAASYKDQQKTKKIQEKRLITMALDDEFFGIKRRPRAVNVNANENFLPHVCYSCFQVQKNPSKGYNYQANILDMNQLFALRGHPKSCYFKYLRLLFTKNECCVDISKNTLNSGELIEFLKDCERAEAGKPKAISEPITYSILFGWLQKAVNKFAYRFSSITFKFLGTVFYWFSSSFMHRLIISSVGMQAIKDANSQTVPVVYILKNHSSIDWFLVMIVLAFFQFVALEASYEFPKNQVIVCKPDGGIPMLTENLKDTVHDEAWLMHVEEHLKVGNHLMFHFDTPDGKHDDYQIETILDSIRRKAVADVLLTPVIISSEKKPDKFSEENFSKKSLLSKLVDLFWRRKYNFGFVKIDFLQPSSLKELMLSLRGRSENLHEMSQIDNSSLTTKVVSHISYDMSMAQPVMSTSLISFLLLKKFRTGVTLRNLVAEVDEVRSDFKFLQRQIGFTGSSELVINHAIRVLGPSLVNVKHKQDTECLITPIVKIPSVLETAHYANDTVSCFMPNSIIMTSVAVIFKDELKTAFKDGDELKFSYYDVFDWATELCDVLQFEHAFTKPCQDLEVRLNDAFFRFANNNMFTKVEKLLTEEEQWGHRYAKHLEDSDSYDDEYEDDLSPSRSVRPKNKDFYLMNLACEKSVFKEIVFYKNLLKPVIDTYIASAEHLSVLIDQQMPDYVFYKMLTDKLTTMLNENQLMYAESLSVDFMYNSMRLFERWQVIIPYSIGGIQLFYLSENYNNVERLSSVVNKIKVFQ